MSVYRDDDGGLAARIAHLEDEVTRRRALLGDEETLALFIDEGRMEELEALCLAAESEQPPIYRAEALARYVAGLEAFVMYATELNQTIQIVRPSDEQDAFALLRPLGGNLASPRPLPLEHAKIEGMLARHGAREIALEEGAQARFYDTPLADSCATLGARYVLRLFVQSQFIYDGVPMVLRHESGTEHSVGLTQGFQLRCGVPRALGDLWVRKETMADALWHKPIRRIQDIEFDDAVFDKCFVISGDEVGARAALGYAARRALLALHAIDRDVGLHISRGIACVVLPNALAERCIEHALRLLGHLHRVQVVRKLVERP